MPARRDVSGERLYRTEAIVVRRRDQGEADRVLTLCTPLGKLEVIAKGVRRIRSRKAGHLELFAHARLIVARSRSSWDVISQAETVEPNASLRGDLVCGTYARYVVELYDRFVTEGEGGEALFDLLARTLQYLCQEERPELLVRAYEQRLLALVGFRPEWDRCVGERARRACERALDADGGEPFGLDPERGGALCAECYQTAREMRGVIPLSAAALQLLRACGRESFAQLCQRKTPPALLREVERAARHYITHHLERDVRTGVFLRRLRREQRKWPV
jgi:DNA repair protein RecO (recombination protein O)